MNHIKTHRAAIIAAVIIAVALAAAYFCGGVTDNDTADSGALSAQSSTEAANESGENTADEDIENNPNDDAATHDTDTNEQTQQNSAANEKHSHENGIKIDEKTGTDEHKTVPSPVGKPTPAEPQQAQITETELTCTLSVRCDTAVGKTSGKESVIPTDGMILPEQTVVFHEGESVFNVLVREMKRNKIHLEFVNTPVYNSAYIEGIGNLYEFDCGELSGWMYRVNGWFPNYGCSRYQLRDGDKIEWVYTCDLGKDIGGGYSARNGAVNE